MQVLLAKNCRSQMVHTRHPRPAWGAWGGWKRMLLSTVGQGRCIPPAHRLVNRPYSELDGHLAGRPCGSPLLTRKALVLVSVLVSVGFSFGCRVVRNSAESVLLKPLTTQGSCAIMRNDASRQIQRGRGWGQRGAWGRQQAFFLPLPGATALCHKPCQRTVALPTAILPLPSATAGRGSRGLPQAEILSLVTRSSPEAKKRTEQIR